MFYTGCHWITQKRNIPQVHPRTLQQQRRGKEEEVHHKQKLMELQSLLKEESWSPQEVLTPSVVVGAYKSLLKEKEALEASLKALGTPRGCSSPQNRTGLQVPAQKSPGEESDRSVGPSPTNQDDDDDDDDGLQHKVNTLMQSLATLSEEKARIEASFQADRKVMLVNQQTLYKQLQTEREKAEKEHNELRKQLENVQSTLQQQQRERREEEVHHKEMWMELQSLLAREQGSKEDLALKICTEWIIPGRQ
ncbi:GRIP and coiled-coil domain-containing protein 1-like isoform X2 [Dysidea avara]|uniref:GRIP and coiled-coil domain-containing protein 1-like isoform X2 n=1 Tax=Dysidea avara TaxID=196820 RepID=UPI00332F0EF5